MPKYPARQKNSGYIRQDAVDPLYAEAEERVYRWLLAGGFQVEDARNLRTYYDFAIVSRGAKWAIDVKCDSMAHTTGRLAFETEMWRGPRETPRWKAPGWAMHEELSYAAFILPQTWRLVLVDMERLREVMDGVEKGFVNPEPGDWYAFVRLNNDDLHGCGIAISIDYLRSMGCLKKESNLE